MQNTVTKATSNSCHKSHFNRLSLFFSLKIVVHCGKIFFQLTTSNISHFMALRVPNSFSSSDLLHLIQFRSRERYECDYETCLCLLLQLVSFFHACNDVFLAFLRGCFSMGNMMMTARRCKLIHFHSNNLQCNLRRGGKFQKVFNLKTILKNLKKLFLLNLWNWQKKIKIKLKKLKISHPLTFPNNLFPLHIF